MSLLIVTMRPLHIVLGVFWAGTLIFMATYLVPAVTGLILGIGGIAAIVAFIVGIGVMRPAHS